MAQASVTNEGEVLLDGRSYRIEGRVQRELATRFAPKTVIGDYTDESNPLISTATWRSWDGGFGLETVRENGYTVSNVRLSYTTEDRKWQATAFVENVTDEEYLVQTFDLSGLDVFGMTEQYYGRPRWWGVSLSYRFGN